ncbi:MAG: alkaline phosphatase family protein, partial [Anaerolineales bacterium]|nr:alkaline phosphatase family protein [Anaerolineales bacterium]
YAYFRDNVLTPQGDQVTAEVAVQVLASEPFDFAFVYFGTVDEAGHAHGWLSDGYFDQLARTDQALKRVLDPLPADSHVLLQADHGGHDRTHGTPAPEDMTIPWMVAGPSIRPGYTLPGPVSLLDTAPTLARLLGLTPHPQWEGRCVEAAFL